MTFIDSILQHLDSMSADDVIQQIGEGIYKEGVPRDEILAYPQFIQDIVFLIDMDTELQMQGDLTNFSVKKHIPNMIIALKNMHEDSEANLLQNIHDIYSASSYEEDVTDKVDTLLDELYSKMYFETGNDIWSSLEMYVELEINKKQSSLHSS